MLNACLIYLETANAKVSGRFWKQKIFMFSIKMPEADPEIPYRGGPGAVEFLGSGDCVDVPFIYIPYVLVTVETKVHIVNTV